jgi:hypothetical protein
MSSRILLNLGGIHAVFRQSPLFEEFLAVLAVRQVIDGLMQAGLDLGLVTVPDRLNEQIAEPLLAEELAEDVEDTSTERLPLQLDLFQEALVYVTFSRLFRQQIPEMAYFGLADAVNAPEPLFQPVRVPRQVIIDHQVRPL